MTNMYKIMKKQLPLVILCMLLPQAGAYAHSIGLGLGAFYDGFFHPFTVFEYIIPMAALSILVGQHDRKNAGKALFFLLTGLLAGMALTANVPYQKTFMILHYSMFMLTGILAAASLRMPVWLLFCIVACSGVILGYINGIEVVTATSPFLFSSGILAGFGIFFLWSTSLLTALKKQWMRIGLRIVSSWIAAVGLLLLGLRV
jgi:hydrogenase/urease accessory protein HupE